VRLRLTPQPVHEAAHLGPLAREAGRHRVVGPVRPCSHLEWRGERAVFEQLAHQRRAPERHTLSGERRTDELVIVVECQHARRLERPDPGPVQPQAPAQPRGRKTGIVQLEQHVMAQIGRPGERARAVAQQGRRAHRDQRLVEQVRRPLGRRVRLAVADRHVDALPIQIEHAVVGGDAHVDLGVRQMEAAQTRNQPQPAEGERRGDRHAGALLAAGQAVHHIGDLPQRAADCAIELLPLHGELQPARLAHEQAHAQALLERLDLAAYRRLGDEQLVGRASEVQVAGGRLEAAQQVQRRDRAGCLSHA
jgi:hypothetical protein